MPFAISATILWLKHKAFAFKRLFYGMSCNEFIENSTDLRPLREAGGKAAFCPVCGFAMAEWSVPEGWTAIICSATTEFDSDFVKAIAHLSQ